MLITIVLRFFANFVYIIFRSMNITQENTDKLNAILKVKVEQADYDERVDKVLERLPQESQG